MSIVDGTHFVHYNNDTISSASEDRMMKTGVARNGSDDGAGGGGGGTPVVPKMEVPDHSGVQPVFNALSKVFGNYDDDDGSFLR